MIVKYLAVALICSNGICQWEEGRKAHDEKWQCLYELADMRPKYYENKVLKFVDCKAITSYKHGE
jgi:hypothetical protein